MELSPEDALRLNVLIASGVQAVRIDAQAMIVHGLTERGDAAIPLHPSGRKEAYLRLVRELLSGHALGSPGGFPVYALRGGNCPDWIVPSGMQCKAQIAPRGDSHASNLQRGSAPAGGNPTGQFPPRKAYLRQWTRSGQPMGNNLDKLLLLGEPEAVVSVAYSPHITGELARRAWWAMPTADNARRMLERDCVAEAPVGKVLADFLIEHLPFESDPHVMMDTVRIVLHPGLLNDVVRLRLWNMASRNNAYYVPFLQRVPDDLPGAKTARADWDEIRISLAHLVESANPYAATVVRALSGNGQAFLLACEDVLLRPANRDVALAALNALAAYFSAVRLKGESADSPIGANDTAAHEVLAILPTLDNTLRAMRILSHMDAETIRPILARTTAEGTLMRKKLEPVLTPLLRQVAVLRGT